jgi:pimeloyl-ACP methyl ester carboxylesterase
LFDERRDAYPHWLMIPVHFGSSDRLLFGVYTPAAEPRKRRGVVVCNPWGMEALRAHRTLRQLGHLLASNGFDVLRFDYSGTGDSFGEATAVRLADWIEDAEMAVEELIALSGVTSVALVGLRLGSYVAAAVAARTSATTDRVILWEPVFPDSPQVKILTNGNGGISSDHGSVAFPVPPQFANDVAAISLRGLPGADVRALIVHSPQGSENGVDAAVRDAAMTAREMEVSRIDAVPCWVEEREFGAGAVPVDVLRSIAAWLK